MNSESDRNASERPTATVKEELKATIERQLVDSDNNPTSKHSSHTEETQSRAHPATDVKDEETERKLREFSERLAEVQG